METIEIDGFAYEFPDLASQAKGIAYSRKGARAYFVTLGPEMAKRLLDFNTDNYRKVRPKHVNYLTGQMRAGDFLMNGDPIRVREDLIIADGQHRLHALSNQESDTTIEFLIVDNLPEETISTIDSNAINRSYVDHLRRRGYQNATMRSSLVTIYHKWCNDRPLDSTYVASIRELDQVHDPEEAKITHAVSNTVGLARKIKGLPATLVSLSHLILCEHSPLAFMSLLIGVAEGEDIHRGMPAYTLRAQLQRDYDNSIKRTRAELMWFIFKCFDIQHKNTMRWDDDQLTIMRLTLPPQGVSTRDLKRMLVKD